MRTIGREERASRMTKLQMVEYAATVRQRTESSIKSVRNVSDVGTQYVIANQAFCNLSDLIKILSCPAEPLVDLQQWLLNELNIMRDWMSTEKASNPYFLDYRKKRKGEKK